MKTYLVGIDGSNTPDPKYWEARNEFINASSEAEAKERWIAMKSEWLREEEKQFIQVREVSMSVESAFASDFRFTDTGFE